MSEFKSTGTIANVDFHIVENCVSRDRSCLWA